MEFISNKMDNLSVIPSKKIFQSSFQLFVQACGNALAANTTIQQENHRISTENQKNISTAKMFFNTTKVF